MVKSIPVRKKLRGIAEMPLADHRGGITLLLEQFGERDLPGVDTCPGLGAMVEIEACSWRVGACHQGSTRWSTKRRRVKTGKAHTFCSHAIDVRSPDIRMPVNSQVTPTLVIRKKNNEVRVSCSQHNCWQSENKNKTNQPKETHCNPDGQVYHLNLA